MQASSFAQQRSLWLISKDNNCPMEVLTIETGGSKLCRSSASKEEAENLPQASSAFSRGL